MHFGFDEDQQALAEAVNGYLERSAPALGSVPDAQTWAAFVRELDLIGLTVPEEFGGAGATLVDQSAVLRELGRVLYGGPYLTTAGIAVQVLLDADPAAAEQWLRDIAAGHATPAVVGLNLAAPLIEARQQDRRWVLEGEVGHVLDAPGADRLLVFAKAAGDLGLFAVTPSGEAEITALTGIDPTRSLGRVRFDSTPAQRIDGPGGGAEQHRKAFDAASALASAEAVGAAERALQLAVDYAKQRTQFNRPIGSFQAVKHRLADMSIILEGARAASLYAAWAVATSQPDRHTAASVALLSSGEALHTASTGAIQVFGGIGFTWEHPIHYFLRRALSGRAILASASTLRRELASVGAAS